MAPPTKPPVAKSNVADAAAVESLVPWMKFARAEEGKKVHEIAAKDKFIDQMRRSLQMQEQLSQMQLRLESLGSPTVREPLNNRFKLTDKQLRNPVPGLVGEMEAPKLAAANPEIAKYFDGLKTDPSYDKKGRSFDIGHVNAGEWHASVTAWCAAFVNWCLKQAGAPHLGYATAKSWLEFGQTIANPVYGCITIIKPSNSTGSTTGHVAFYVRHEGNKIVLLGGNQSDRVKESKFPEKWVQKDGYRWPTTMKDYLAASKQSLLLEIRNAVAEGLAPLRK